MAKPNFRMVTVHQSQQISPNYQRIWLTGASLADFPKDSNGGYIKLVFGPDLQALATIDKLHSLTERPILRTYTVRHFEPSKQKMVVDMVRHGEGMSSGPASRWAKRVKLGDSILIGGPGPAKKMNEAADRFVLAGDMTALPAISVNLESLPADAKGIAIIEITHEEDKQELVKPEGIDVQWIINDSPDQPNTFLFDAVKAIDWPSEKVSAWVACEFSNMRLIRKFLKTEKKVERDFLYVSSYWKMGHTEEQHKVVKREDSDQEEAVVTHN